VENTIVRTLKSVKALDNSVITMAYLNSILMMPYFALSKKMYANASKLLLRDKNSNVMKFAGDGGTGFFCSDFPTYDLTQEAAGAAILADFSTMQSSGAVDGIYLDKSATWPGYGDSPAVQGKDSLCQHECYTMTPNQTSAYIAGRLNLFRGFDQACGTSGICSMDARIVNVPQVASMVNNYTPRSIHIFRAAVKTSYTNATVNFVRGLEGKTEHLLWYGTCQTQTEVAFFLVMAWPGCYCMTFSNTDTAQQLWTSGWHYGTHLGAPAGSHGFKTNFNKQISKQNSKTPQDRRNLSMTRPGSDTLQVARRQDTTFILATER
jgi:hypothetical protein